LLRQNCNSKLEQNLKGECQSIFRNQVWLNSKEEQKYINKPIYLEFTRSI
jgi:hypothetical protein